MSTKCDEKKVLHHQVTTNIYTSCLPPCLHAVLLELIHLKLQNNKRGNKIVINREFSNKKWRISVWWRKKITEVPFSPETVLWSSTWCNSQFTILSKNWKHFVSNIKFRVKIPFKCCVSCWMSTFLANLNDWSHLKNKENLGKSLRFEFPLSKPSKCNSFLPSTFDYITKDIWEEETFRMNSNLRYFKVFVGLQVNLNFPPFSHSKPSK